MLEAVWHHAFSPMAAGAGGAATAMVSRAVSRAELEAEERVSRVEDATRRVAERNVGGVALRPMRSRERDMGAGEAIERPGVRFVGEGSKSPWGWLRVDTIVATSRRVVRLVWEYVVEWVRWVFVKKVFDVLL